MLDCEGMCNVFHCLLYAVPRMAEVQRELARKLGRCAPLGEPGRQGPSPPFKPSLSWTGLGFGVSSSGNEWQSTTPGWPRNDRCEFRESELKTMLDSYAPHRLPP